jgi:uncharacterized membrane protein
MDTYTVIKFLHLAFAIAWLGGGLCLNLLGARASRANDKGDLVRIIQQVAYLEDHMLAPSALLTLVFGVVMAWMAGLFGTLWVIIGLVAFLGSLGNGVAVLKPRVQKVIALVARTALRPRRSAKRARSCGSRNSKPSCCFHARASGASPTVCYRLGHVSVRPHAPTSSTPRRNWCIKKATHSERLSSRLLI